MSNTNLAVQVEGLSKVYRLGMDERNADNISSMIYGMMKNPIKNFKKYRALYDFSDIEISEENTFERTVSDAFWAIRDISFDVKPGEALGIVGSNGAGKSTLLKILSRITPPTRGRAVLQGRLNSLLEVGTGFHPELTGRENVFLNGSVLGMRRKEIEAKFDEIVDFSGVEQFLDTPVKRYSSGMRVRLAFAVAAHLEPEILIVDEVLAVGDAEFQRKCLSKMANSGEMGQTILFVSHNMPAISRLCDRVILLRDGQLVMDGPTSSVLSAYLAHERSVQTHARWDDPATAPAGDVIRMRSVRVRDEAGNRGPNFDIRKELGVELEYEILKPGFSIMPSFSIWNDQGTNLGVAIDQDLEWRAKPRAVGVYRSTGWIPGNLLAEGIFSLNVVLWTMDPVRKMQFKIEEVASFQVTDSLEGDSARGEFQGDLPGLIRPALRWTTELEKDAQYA